MKKIWQLISYIGLKDHGKDLLNRSKILTNRINFIMLIVMCLLSLVNILGSRYDSAPMALGSYRVFMMMGVNILIFILTYFGFFKLSKILLVFTPAIILLIMPTLFIFVEPESYFYYPIAIIGIGLLPQILFIPKKEKIIFWFSMGFFFLLLLGLFEFMVYFSPEEFDVIDTIKTFLLYYKLIPVILFVFTQAALYYLRFLNVNFENELIKYNNDLNDTIEELKVTQQNLVQSEKMASLGTLTSGVAHEINNPLNYIIGGLELMLMTKNNIEKYSLDQLKERCTQASEVINAGAQKVSKIVTSLIAFSDRGEPEIELVKISELVENTIILIKSQITEDIEILKDYKFDIKIRVFKAKILQVLYNILENAVIAVQSNPQEKVIKITSSSDENFAIIKIFNNGPAISESNLSKIFDPFFTTREPGQGPGLGLSIAYSHISDHDGRIYAENKKNGVELIIKLPLN